MRRSSLRAALERLDASVGFFEGTGTNLGCNADPFPLHRLSYFVYGHTGCSLSFSLALLLDRKLHYRKCACS